MEHRRPKARFTRTDKKDFIKQMTRIERREARLRRIRAKLRRPAIVRNGNARGKKSLDGRYHIGESENVYYHIGTFLRNNAGDPAVKVNLWFNFSLFHPLKMRKDYLPELKKHLGERILITAAGNQNVSDTEITSAAGSVLFKHDRIYEHKVFRINYTTYDARRAQDVINPDTSHCNVMVLNGSHTEDSNDGDKNQRLFLYARVLRVCHANIVYVGRGGADYQPHRMNFLWVRWYEQVDSASTGWSNRKLDRARFPSFAGSTGGSVGFLDPSVVLRACHIIPIFHKGRRYEDGKGISFCGRDSSDWNEYYINR